MKRITVFLEDDLYDQVVKKGKAARPHAGRGLLSEIGREAFELWAGNKR